VTGKTSLLGLVQGMTAEAPLLLKVEDESPDLCRPDVSHIGGKAFRTQKLLQVSHAAGNDGYGLIALALGTGEIFSPNLRNQALRSISTKGSMQGS